MLTLFIMVHVSVCVLLVVAVLLQAGKGGGLAGSFGAGGGSQALFGGRGAATFLSKATVVLGALFFVSSLGLAILSTQNVGGGRRSVVQEAAQKAAGSQAPAPAPGATPTQAPQGGAQPTQAPPSGAPAGTNPAPQGTGNNPPPGNPQAK